MLFLATDDLMAEVKGAMSRPVTAELKAQHEEAKSKIKSACNLGELTCGVSSQHAENSRILSVTGSSAEIIITGAMVNELSFWAWIMGATSYKEVTAAAKALVADDEIQEVSLRIGSGGGTVEGMIACSESLKELRASGKLKVAYIDGLCASAAYGLGAQAETMIAMSAGEIVGSVGAMTYRVKYNEVEELAIRGDNSQDKNADAFTEAGYKVVKEEVNDFEDMYLQMVADGRGVPVATVKANYGNGKIMSARNALKSGMIDAIASQSGSALAGTQTNLTAQGETEHNLTANSEEVMNKAELQAKHPELYAEIKNEGKAEGVDSGKKQEQDRVSAFMDIGEASGAMDLAMACIKDGSEPSNALTMKFSAAGMRNQSLSAMAEDNVDTDGVKPEAPAAKTFDDDIAAAMDEERGEFY
ncbi:ClpP/crotonase-like domain protein [Vibrio phage 1.086.O._10N.222.51.F8]|nr:ClpP/crotonase-like domain protein [Vibrio phage 1.086.O._10N.222.51.F8]